MSNPFLQSMTRLQIPAHMGNSVSVAGFFLEADKDGCIEVPAEHVSTLLAHGLTPAPKAEEKKAK